MKPESRRFIGPLLPSQSQRRDRAMRRMNHIKSFAYSYNVPISWIFQNWMDFRNQARTAGIYDL